MIIHKPLVPTAVIIFQISSISEIKIVPLDAADTICLMVCIYEFLRDEREGAVQRSTAFPSNISDIISVHFKIISTCIFNLVNRYILGM